MSTRAPTLWYARRDYCVWFMLAGLLAPLIAIWFALGEPPTAAKFAVLQHSWARVLIGALAFVIFGRFGWVGLTWYRHRRPLATVSDTELTLHGLGTLVIPYRELVELATTNDGQGLRVATRRHRRRFIIPIDGADWNSVVREVHDRSRLG